MAISISAPVGPWEDPVIIRNGGNKNSDVEIIQTLLEHAAEKTGNRMFNPYGVDGKIARSPKTSNTLTALKNFQAQFLRSPDARVDVGGTTWKNLSGYGQAPAPQPPGTAPAPVSPPAASPAVLIMYGGHRVPWFGQFQAPWSTQILGTGSSIAAKGCAITSISMILRYYDRSNVNPGTLDEYLDANDGYVGNNVIWARAFQAYQSAGKPTLVLTQHQFTDSTQFADVLNSRIEKNWPTLAHVDYGADAGLGGDHWVVVVGRTADGYFVINDPGTSRGDGASNPNQDVTILGKSTRKGGLNLVRLCLFDVV